MGTDYIKLFNKHLADQLLIMDLDSLTRFIEENISILREKEDGIGYSCLLCVVDETDSSVKESLNHLLSTDYSFTDLRRNIALDFAFGEEDVYLDYYGCWVEVFRDEPEGIIHSTEYLHETEGELWFTLLKPSHVDQIIQSLRKHLDDLTIMNQTA